MGQVGMDELINRIKSSSKIIIFVKISDKKSLNNADCFYNYLSNYCLLKDYDKKIITHYLNSDYVDYLIRMYNITKCLLYVKSKKEPLPLDSLCRRMDLILEVRDNNVIVRKDRYNISTGVVYNLMDIKIFQRKNKLNKIISNIKNETNFTKKIGKYLFGFIRTN